MPTTLYHATPYNGLISDIDLDIANNTTSNAKMLGNGFYATPNMGFAIDQAFDGGLGNQPGFIYRFQVPDLVDADGMEHGQRFINGRQGIDRTLVDRVAKSIESFGGEANIQAAQDIRNKFHTDLAEQKKFYGSRFEAAAAYIEELRSKGEKIDIFVLRRTGYTELEETMKRLNNGMLNDSAAGFVLGVQKDYINGKNGIKSSDIFSRANIDFLQVEGWNAIWVNNQSKPDIIPHSSFHHNSTGSLLDAMNNEKLSLNTFTDKSLRQMIVETALAERNNAPDAYERFQSLRRAMETHIPNMPRNIAEHLNTAEIHAAKAAGLNEADIRLKKEARDVVAQRPVRLEGEGFHGYSKRVIDWYDHAHPGIAAPVRQEFLTQLRDELFIDVQIRFARMTADPLLVLRDPRVLERMLQDVRRDIATESLNGIGSIEYEMGTHVNAPDFKMPSDLPSTFSTVTRKMGMLGGIIIGVSLALKGEFAQAAAAVTPGGDSALALTKGDTKQAAISGIDEFTFGAASLMQAGFDEKRAWRSISMNELNYTQEELLRMSGMIPEKINGKPAVQALQNPDTLNSYYELAKRQGNEEAATALKEFGEVEKIRQYKLSTETSNASTSVYDPNPKS